MNFKEYWPVSHYANENYVGWDYTDDDWHSLTGIVLELIDSEIGENIYTEIRDEVKHGSKRRNPLV